MTNFIKVGDKVLNFAHVRLCEIKNAKDSTRRIIHVEYMDGEVIETGYTAERWDYIMTRLS